jgi:hypothetical protein
VPLRLTTRIQVGDAHRSFQFGGGRPPLSRNSEIGMGGHPGPRRDPSARPRPRSVTTPCAACRASIRPMLPRGCECAAVLRHCCDLLIDCPVNDTPTLPDARGSLWGTSEMVRKSHFSDMPSRSLMSVVRVERTWLSGNQNDANDPYRSSEHRRTGRFGEKDGREARYEAIAQSRARSLGLSRRFCRTHRKQRLCNGIVRKGPQNIFVTGSSLIQFASLEIE